MRVAVVLAILMILGGASAAYIAFETSINPSNKLRSVVVEAVDGIKQADNLINSLVLESRYGLTADYDELAKLIIKLREGMATLKFGEARSYVADNALANQSLNDLAEQFSLKIDLIENFKSHNSVLRNSIRYAPELGDQLIAEAEVNADAGAVALLKQVNSALYRWILYANDSDAKIIKENASHLIEVNNAIDDDIALIEYSTHVITIVEEQKKTQGYTEGALAISTQLAISQLESAYLDHYLEILKASESRKYYFFLYALFLISIFIYFTLRFRKNYTVLQGRDNYRSQQVSIAYKHLGYADIHVDNMQGTFVSIKEALSCLGGISLEAKKKDYDSRKINTLLTQALKKYNHLENDNAIDKADELLDKSNENLGKASRVIKSLMVSSA